jgi:hypothetical protein
MPLDLYKPDHRTNFKREVDWSFEQLQPFRKSRLDLLRMYVGNKYGSDVLPAGQRQLVYQLRQAALIYSMLLTPKQPRAFTKTIYTELLAESKRFQINLNNLIKIIKPEDQGRLIVLDALFRIGIGKVGLGSSMSVKFDDDNRTDPGFPFFDHISLDNYAHDMKAKSLRNLRWACDWYDVDRMELEDSDVFDKDVVDKLKNGWSHGSGEDRAADLGRGTDYFDDDKIRLVDVWIPSERKIYTMDADMSLEPLHVANYTGSPGGPYKYLCFGPVPDNTMPLGILEDIEAMSRVFNYSYRKLVDQLKRQKTNLAYNSGSEKDAEAWKDAVDGEAFAVDDIDNIKILNNGSIDQQSFAFLLNLQKQVDRQSNASVLGGLGAQTDTVGQEQIVSKQAGAVFSDLQSTTAGFYAEVFNELGWHLHEDQVGMRASIDAGEYGFPNIRFDRSWLPDERKGQFNQYTIDVDPSSMVFTTPEQKYGKLMRTLKELIIPLATSPLGAEGSPLDLKKIIADVADLQDLPELRNWYRDRSGKIPDPEQPEQQNPFDQGGGEYIHHTAGGGNQGSSEDEQIMAMMASAGRDNNQ